MCTTLRLWLYNREFAMKVAHPRDKWSSDWYYCIYRSSWYWAHWWVGVPCWATRILASYWLGRPWLWAAWKSGPVRARGWRDCEQIKLAKESWAHSWIGSKSLCRSGPAGCWGCTSGTRIGRSAGSCWGWSPISRCSSIWSCRSWSPKWRAAVSQGCSCRRSGCCCRTSWFWPGCLE